MTVVLGVPVLSNYTGLQQLIESTYSSHIAVDHIIIVDNGGLLGMPEWLPSHATVIQPAQNMGVAASWNRMARMVKTMYMSVPDKDIHLIISNDDVILHPTTIEAFVASHTDNPDVYVWTWAENSWSLFLQSLESFNTVGFYDESFYPAYWEDRDYAYRLKLIHRPHQCCKEATAIHAGSMTIKSYAEADLEEKHHKYFRRNEERYTRKWGGNYGSEHYQQPWNGNIEL